MPLPTRPAHDGNLQPRLDFAAACVLAAQNPGREFHTLSGTPFHVECRVTSKGDHKGEAALVFSNLHGEEQSRSYACCWQHEINCNRTWLKMYSEVLG